MHARSLQPSHRTQAHGQLQKLFSTILLLLLYAWRHLRQEGGLVKTIQKKVEEEAELCNVAGAGTSLE